MIDEGSNGLTHQLLAAKKSMLDIKSSRRQMLRSPDLERLLKSPL